MIALNALIDEHHDAIAYDLIALGLRLRDLGSEEFKWGDLRAITTQAPRHSCLYRSLHPEDAEWGLSEHLLAIVADQLTVGNWQRGQGKRHEYPKPIPRPGVAAEGENTFGAGAISIDEMADWLGGAFSKN